MVLYNQAKDPEEIPLTGLPLYEEEEQDLGEEHLPTYNEAVTSHSPTTETRENNERPQSPVNAPITTSEPARVGSPVQGPPATRRGSLPPLAGVAYLLLSIGLLVTGIVLYS